MSRIQTDANTTGQEATVDQSAQSYLKEVEERYNRRLDTDVQVLLDSFNDIVRVASIQDKDKFRVAQEAFQIELRASNIVKASESLLALISDLKMALYLQDTTTLMSTQASRKAAVDDERQRVIQDINQAWNEKMK